MKKKLLSIMCAFLLVASLGVLWVDSNPSHAAESVKYYYGTSLATSVDGSTTVTSSLSGGLEITFGKASSASSARYNHTLDMSKFGVSFYFTNANFEETWFQFTDNDNNSKWLKLYLKKSNDKIDYKFEDNYANETEYKSTGIDFATFTNTQSNLQLTYDPTADVKFTFGDQDLDTGSIQTLSFYKNVANMSFGVTGVSGDEGQNDTVIRIMSITNSNGTQPLETSDSKFEGEKRIAPIIIPMEDGRDEHIKAGDADPVAIELKGASDSEYTFPYHCIDVLGTGWQVLTTEDNGDSAASSETPDKVAGKTKHALGKAGAKYTFKIYTLYADEHPALILNVTAVDDNGSVKINQAQFNEFINSSEELNVPHLVAPKNSNTFEFPHIYRNNFAAQGDESKVLTAGDDLDTFDNIKIQVGYRAPGDSGEFTYAAAYAVQINKTGMWSFRYKVTDAAGNITESEVFQRRVFDEDPPVINIDRNVEITVNQKYTVPSATITDNASGVDSDFSTWKLFYANADGSKGEEIKNLKEGDEGYKDNLLKDGVLTPTALTQADRDASFIIVYYAQDLDGNVAEPVEVLVKVVQGTPSYAPNPWNDFFRTALIVIACLAGTGIIVLIFIRPKKALK